MSKSRRQFLEASLAACLSASFPVSQVLALNLLSEDEREQEMAKRSAALHILRLASPYPADQSDFIPHMHQVFKKNVESMTRGKIYVDVHHSGALGSGRELMAAVTRGHVEAALISVSNLSRALPVLDILNIPFWASSNREFLNLICSPQWQSLVIKPISEQGKLNILMHHLVGGRTLTSTKQFNRLINLPEKLKGVVLRVPASMVLSHFYSMTSANVIDVPWAQVAKMARTKHIEVIDPSVIGLFAGPDLLKSEIGQVALLESVPDAWVTVANQHWLDSLPLRLKGEIEDASKQTFHTHIAQIEQLQKRCERELMALGAKLHPLSVDEKREWQLKFGHHNAQWNKVKRELLGSTRAFQQLVNATEKEFTQ
ncbi:TRAP transporter substrate-binding protein DctP [Pseudoalteromonas sp. L23]|uniref:TRAP transporter substrate-binding protein n=1 Tax=unclassified Pseudoalteromonas TaxID=194690 RepID=UPI001F3D0BF6|nr:MULTISPECIES: TRAP transporter substrate-binding protein DctP [unclassified Pseudoalteromonas]MCF2828972.1 TRAP transporter substrate-binding protein DctP [Pseudoalteromonas sp. OF5H-5]MCF2829872.1 TRAP transporter substrate-binding protein DctP [Pseudoalteromonas sp. DL2-H6]MCF2926213.1 TRAP transporter substrate-binding protein DctP [Pseudoalteromonas sp. DL2-H1]MCF7514827.1 TRAP transporter substrate-binding protein DctP [Pseudoalteromonas sp. L7]MCF7526869.1 TRAP transporter substrate-b